MGNFARPASALVLTAALIAAARNKGTQPEGHGSDSFHSLSLTAPVGQVDTTQISQATRTSIHNWWNRLVRDAQGKGALSDRTALRLKLLPISDIVDLSRLQDASSSGATPVNEDLFFRLQGGPVRDVQRLMQWVDTSNTGFAGTRLDLDNPRVRKAFETFKGLDQDGSPGSFQQKLGVCGLLEKAVRSAPGYREALESPLSSEARRRFDTNARSSASSALVEQMDLVQQRVLGR